jgi:hypothetical protein
MNNPIPRVDFFRTPESFADLAAYAADTANQSESLRMVYFTMNYCHALAQAEITRATCAELLADK